jgi:hypothetical protein
MLAAGGSVQIGVRRREPISCRPRSNGGISNHALKLPLKENGKLAPMMESRQVRARLIDH